MTDKSFSGYLKVIGAAIQPEHSPKNDEETGNLVACLLSLATSLSVIASGSQPTQQKINKITDKMNEALQMQLIMIAFEDFAAEKEATK